MRGVAIKSLWLLECEDVECYSQLLFPLYAVDEDEANEVAMLIVEERPHLRFVKLGEWPQRFVLVRRRLPDSIEHTK